MKQSIDHTLHTFQQVLGISGEKKKPACYLKRAGTRVQLTGLELIEAIASFQLRHVVLDFQMQQIKK